MDFNEPAHAFLRGLGEDGDDSSDPDPDGDYNEMPHLSDAAEDPDETESTGSCGPRVGGVSPDFLKMRACRNTSLSLIVESLEIHAGSYLSGG